MCFIGVTIDDLSIYFFRVIVWYFIVVVIFVGEMNVEGWNMMILLKLMGDVLVMNVF